MHLFKPSSVLAVQASPHAFSVTQPDGSQVMLHIRGDEHFHWQEDQHGYTVMRDKGRYVYAQRDKDTGRLKPTPWQAGKVDPAARGLKKRELPSPGVIRELRSKSMQGPAEGSSEQQVSAASVTGFVKNLVVLVRFADHVGRTLPTAGTLMVMAWSILLIS
ncbi:MAG: hypothetical protein KAJ95_01390 [Gammaproteobacteria bacterium]|nr:hypothetical protein [Gammaproteobacteria bacterium]